MCILGVTSDYFHNLYIYIYIYIYISYVKIYREKDLYILYISLYIYFDVANRADPDEMTLSVAFRLRLHYQFSIGR